MKNLAAALVATLALGAGTLAAVAPASAAVRDDGAHHARHTAKDDPAGHAAHPRKRHG